MAVSGIGETYSYIYNSQTGKLSTKDGSKDAFVDYFNGEASEEALDDLNGFDATRKRDIQKMIKFFSCGMTKDVFNEKNGTEFEITAEVENATTAHYSVNGEKVFTAYSAVSYTYEEVNAFRTVQQPYKTKQHKDYCPETNSISIAVGDVFDMKNGYTFTVKRDHIWGEGYDGKSEESNKKANQFVWGLNALMHFADQQWPSSWMDKESTPMMIEFLNQLGVDTTKEFAINETRCEIRNGRIMEVGNNNVVPSSIHNAAVKRYEEMLYQPLSTWKK